MVYRMIGACCLALLVPGMVRAQTAAKTPEQLTKDVQDLQQKLTTASANLTKLAEQVAKNTEAITRNCAGHRTSDDGHQRRVAETAGNPGRESTS